MPTSKLITLFAIFGLAAYSHVSARPQILSGTRVRILTDDSALQDIETAGYVEMKRTKLLRGQYSYTLGERVIGDKLAHQEEDSDDFPAARDVEASINYPKVSPGLTLTYIHILVEQSSEEGVGYVTSGGINQKTAEILIIARNTTHYAHSGSFYGY